VNSKSNSNLDRLSQQFLVHSYLYYQLNESIIGDEKYDQLCVSLKKEAEGQNDYLYQELIEPALGNEGSGFAIPTKAYPPRIISTALHLLYQDQYKDKVSLNNFLKSYGYRTK
jgi:hypothetical protein